MTTVLTACLLAVLGGATISFVAMGLAQRHRTRALTGRAHRGGMRFAVDDPFDLPRRYARFALPTCGHSPRARNITYGWLRGLPVRMFDFCCELGHGTRRVTRRCLVATVETDFDLPRLSLWHDEDAELMPLDIQPPDGHIHQWSFCGPRGPAAALAAALGAAHKAVSVQSDGRTLMISLPVGRFRDRCVLEPEEVELFIGTLASLAPEDRGATRTRQAGGQRELPKLDVENPFPS